MIYGRCPQCMHFTNVELGLKMILNSAHLKNSMNPSDMQSSRYPSLLGNSSSGASRHSPTDMPGPSGIAPVQHAPLVSAHESEKIINFPLLPASYEKKPRKLDNSFFFHSVPTVTEEGIRLGSFG